MTHCRHLTPSLTCSDPSQPAEQRGIRCSWRGDCDLDRPAVVMRQIDAEALDVPVQMPAAQAGRAVPVPAAAPGRPASARERLKAARDRLAMAADQRAGRPREMRR
jgi:hypothetical protein